MTRVIYCVSEGMGKLVSCFSKKSDAEAMLGLLKSNTGLDYSIVWVPLDLPPTPIIIVEVDKEGKIVSSGYNYNPKVFFDPYPAFSLNLKNNRVYLSVAVPTRNVDKAKECGVRVFKLIKEKGVEWGDDRALEGLAEQIRRVILSDCIKNSKDMQRTKEG